jgi:hypothetical protein
MARAMVTGREQENNRLRTKKTPLLQEETKLKCIKTSDANNGGMYWSLRRAFRKLNSAVDLEVDNNSITGSEDDNSVMKLYISKRAVQTRTDPLLIANYIGT